MAKTDFKNVDEYIATFPPDVREILQEIRQTIQAAVPEAEEVISYQIPAFNFHGWVFYVSAYKTHYSLACPPPFTVFEAFKERLASYEILKSSIKFPLNEPVPSKLIYEMAQFIRKADFNMNFRARVWKNAGIVDVLLAPSKD
jgi:uncharacterized protein YdhG (YjbR/CyaY superfamily)